MRVGTFFKDPCELEAKARTLLPGPFLIQKSRWMIRTHKENSLGGSTLDTLWTGLGLEVLLTFLSLILIQNNWQKQKSLVNLSTRAKKFLAGGIVLNCKAPITSAHPGPQRDRKQVLPSHFFETKVTNNSEFWVFFLKAEIVIQL